MSIQEDLYALLIADAGVTAIVGDGNSPVTYAVYNSVAEDPPDRFIVYQHISGVNQNQLNGAKLATNHRIQIRCYGVKPGDARTLADAVETALTGTGYIVLRLDDQQDEVTRHYFTQLDWKRWK